MTLVSAVGHLAALAVFVGVQPGPPPPEAAPPPIQVALVEPPPPPPPVIEPPPPAPHDAPTAARTPAKAPPTPKPKPKPKTARSAPHVAARPAKAPPPAAPLVVAQGSAGEADEGPPTPSAAELAGAARAGSGRGDGCDMAGRLQAALRRDARVRAAVDDPRRALWIWNGDWVRHGSQDGHGLAAVREAIVWEVGFAPAACRAEPVRGLVLITLDDGPGSARLVLGANTWRWSDLLHAPQGGVRLRR
ncbi:MAG: hypothetical protein GC203_20280 [Phenylobacterium sp.]|uniref:hypothetical protein n=1 Tax=Phenylobacterium sp. TaxID=1871053 RepID=UPI0025E4DF74|nr:hypothetical protein [Phenylobacterium sp.]MBI1200203.1 hypothetical protein [Phenylobacterium sp.]